MDRDLDRNLLREMRLSLRANPLDTASLGRLVAALESLFALLVGVDETWKRRFVGGWASLEEVFAVMLDRKRDTLDDEGVSIVGAAMSDLRTLVDDALGDEPDFADE